jgi:dTDP-4-dehydrorhamnose reductase
MGGRVSQRNGLDGLRKAAMMEIVVLGSAGQVGVMLTGALRCLASANVTALDREEIDLEDLDAVRAMLRALRPALVVNAAAYTDVDKAEKEEASATRVNAEVVGVIGETCRELRAGLVHYSTDFVFDGASKRAYVEDDPTAPLGAYGRSKLAGEEALARAEAPALVFRTAWVYSPGRKSFVSSILRLAREREVLRIVADQSGSPTYAGDLALATALIIRGLGSDPFAAIDEARGVYHMAGGGVATRFELAEATIADDPRVSEHRVKTLEPIASSAYPLPAARPAYAPLECEKLRRRFGIALPPWREALTRALRQ